MYYSVSVLFGLVNSVWTMHITERQQKKCSIYPSYINLTCVQYDLSDKKDCEEQGLKKWFPHLYNISDSEAPSWPALVPNDHVTAGESYINWTISKDGSINFLKGFQLILTGKTYHSFGLTLCTIIDLGNISKSNIGDLMQSTFSVYTNYSGEFDFTVKALPLPPANVQFPNANEGILTPDSAKTVYYPQLNVTSSYKIINDSTIEITIDVEPKMKGLSSMYLQVYSSENILLDDMSSSIIPSQFQRPVTLSGFQAGDYKIKLTPESALKCFCYRGPEQNKECISCNKYLLQVHIGEHYANQDLNVKKPEINPDEHVSVAVVVAPTLIFPLVIATVILSWFVVKRRTVRCCQREIPLEDNIIDDKTQDKLFTIHIVYANDHSAHKDTIEALGVLLRNSLKCNVISGSRCHELISQHSLSSVESLGHDTVANDVDIICMVHSEWANKLMSIWKSGEISNGDISDIDDKLFLLKINEIDDNHDNQGNKILSVQFEYTPESSTIRKPFLGPLFILPSKIDALIKHICNRTDSDLSSKHPEINTEDINTLISDVTIKKLTADVNSTFAFQSKNKSWLCNKLTNLKNSPSSDDSGVVLLRRSKVHTRSKRSRSMETISCYSCQSTVTTCRTVCIDCHQKQLSKLRTYSCDLSFYPPEHEEHEEMSVRFSLLENKMMDINATYEFIINHKLNIECDCITIAGESI